MTKVCAGPQCTARCTRAKFCRSHQRQLRERDHDERRLTPLRAVNREGVPCRCGKPGVLNSPWGWLCVAHQARWRKHGDPEFDRPLRQRGVVGAPMSRRHVFLWNRYRISEEAFELVLASQGGRCALCRSPSPKGRGTFSVDHDHACSHPRHRAGPSLHGCPDCIRGLLCDDCNQNVLPAIERGVALGLATPAAVLAHYLASRPLSP